ncbi:MAG: GDSL-type esterase/lipase family protein [Tannerellaceae bacterium]|jgi:lysophospholipase L1-like esterase|nr:GDSL-type esterase/lipase family protein [Tannerellaceae bacterium]
MMKRKKRFVKLSRTLIAVGAMVLVGAVLARASTVDPVHSNLRFAIDSLCTVDDEAHALDSFFAELKLLDEGKDTVVSIVHLGDSHIQAGYYTGHAMRLMHAQYGNAGRGWVAPFRLAKTNEPNDYFISSLIKEWTTGSCIQRSKKSPVGLGGIGLQTVSPFVNFDLSIAPVNGAGYGFNRVVLFRGEKSMPMLPSGTWKDSVTVSEGEFPCLPGVVADTFGISCLTDSLQLQSTRRKQGTDLLYPASSFENVYYGFLMTNGRPGILYHAVGVNGAMFVHYTDEQYVRQLALLNPSLLIISLGTNESFGKRFRIEEFTGQIEAFLALVRKYMPRAAILLTTPPECYRRVWVDKKRVYVRNDNSERVAKAITGMAREKGLACWDLFSATGGKNSCIKWLNGKWMGRDRIHFTKEGYSEQGVLLFQALMRLKAERDGERAGND